MFPNYDRVSIIIIASGKDRKKFYRLFRFILSDKIEQEICHKDRLEFKTDKFWFRFIPKLESTRGFKAHYVLNLTQDKEFDDNVVKSISIIHDYLKKDVKWSELFND